MGSLRMLHTLRQTLARDPDARGRGVHRWHDLEELSLTATRPQGWQVDGDHLGTATGPARPPRAGRSARRRLSLGAVAPSRTPVSVVNVRASACGSVEWRA